MSQKILHKNDQAKKKKKRKGEPRTPQQNTYISHTPEISNKIYHTDKQVLYIRSPPKLE